MDYKFEFNGNNGVVYLTTHLGTKHEIHCTKTNDEIFRLGGTAVNQVDVQPLSNGKYRVEYYPLDMEGNPVQFLELDSPPDPNTIRQIFVNVDIIDGGDNVLRRYRIDPYYGKYKIINVPN